MPCLGCWWQCSMEMAGVVTVAGAEIIQTSSPEANAHPPSEPATEEWRSYARPWLLELVFLCKGGAEIIQASSTAAEVMQCF